MSLHLKRKLSKIYLVIGFQVKVIYRLFAMNGVSLFKEDTSKITITCISLYMHVDVCAGKHDFLNIVIYNDRLWHPIATDKKESIRGFLVMFNFEILKRAYKNFNFRNGSIGNFFLTGARLFFGSLEAGNSSFTIFGVPPINKIKN